jgi:hypothetical protein
MIDPEKHYQGTIENLKRALQQIASGVKTPKKRGGCAWIGLSANEMQEIAAKALEENKN